ncbi:MAG: VCBS repeat-containing protein [Spirochaetales bacterium]|nr:VCBS repeat-containing protein [Spirochaetales bacterium]
MHKPREYTEKLTELKIVSTELQKMLEDRSFYRLSFATRSAWIRKVKRLYGSLRGPLDPINFKPFLAATGFAALTMLSTSCSAPGGGGNGGGGTITPVFAASTINPLEFFDVGTMASPEFADIDNDGDLDVFIGNFDGITRYFQNTGNAAEPAFAAAVTNPFGLADVGFRAFPVFADIDNDGDLDAFIGNNGGNTYYFQNTGNAAEPAFAAAVTNPFGLTDVGDCATSDFVDIDNDGDLDAFIGNFDGITSYFQNTGNASAPAFAAAVTNPFGLTDVGAYAYPVFADMDNDGDVDAYIHSDSFLSTNYFYFQNTGTAAEPAFAAAVTNPFDLPAIGDFTSPVFADIDNDGDLDLFIGDYFGNTQYFQNTGSAAEPSFAEAAANPFGLYSAHRYASPFFGDIDNDGVMDAFIGAEYGNTQYSHNTGSATEPAFAEVVTHPFGLPDPGDRASPAFVDIDNDGDLDAFIGAEDGITRYSQNTGSAAVPSFTVAAVINPFGLTDVGTYASPVFADIDNDGDLDAFIGNGAGNTYYFQNTGSASAPAFAAALINPFSLTDIGDYASPAFADIDNDGDLDAFIGNGAGNTCYFQNTGSAAAPAFAAAVINPFGLTDVGDYASPVCTDIDNDGDLDLCIGVWLDSIYYFENTAL